MRSTNLAVTGEATPPLPCWRFWTQEQNSSLIDHYIQVPYTVIVLFVTTANTLAIPPPLLDRMEVIRHAGYTEHEKIEIAKRHLIRKQTEIHSLNTDEWSISDEALRIIIRRYTREAGVRNLDRELVERP